MLEISQYPNILNESECNSIIELASDKLQTAEVVGENVNGYRTANSCWITDTDNNIINTIKQVVSNHSGLPIENQENPHIVKYENGDRYDSHLDSFNPYDFHQNKKIDSSGNRSHSFLIYLNQDFVGGETHFDIVDITIKPKRGMGLMWNNLHNSNLLNESSHAGFSIINGIKWILIIWIREKSTLPLNKNII